MITIGILGLPNAGKSTFFNKIIGNYRAIVTDIAGTTRDILSESFVYQNRRYKIMDTPWLVNNEPETKIIQKIITSSDYCFFIIDGHLWLTQWEHDIQQMIIKAGKQHQTFLLVNKLEKEIITGKEYEALSEYYELWLEHVIPISAKYGNNIDMIRDIMESMNQIAHQKIPKKHKWDTQIFDFDQNDSIKLALLGKPNAGKSTLLNTLCHQELSCTSDIPWTTLDYVTGYFSYQEHNFAVYDTAGLRRKSIVRWLESIANTKTFKMLEYIRPIVVIILDGNIAITRQDLVILWEIIKLWLGIIIVINKADLLSDNKEMKKKIEEAQEICGYAPYIPVISISAKTGYGLANLYKHIIEVETQTKITLPTSKINAIVSKAFLLSPPKFPKNKICKCKYITQISTDPIVFKVFVNAIDRVNFAMKKWLENIIRKEFKLKGIPFQFNFVANPDKSHRWD
jgi:GTP-binding protein